MKVIRVIVLLWACIVAVAAGLALVIGLYGLILGDEVVRGLGGGVERSPGSITLFVATQVAWMALALFASRWATKKPKDRPTKPRD